VETCLAILVRRSRWSETSLIATWVTDAFGTLQTAARGALRPGGTLTGKLDLFHRTEISVVFSHKSTLHALREVRVIEAFTAGARSYAALALASYFGELTAAVSPPMQPAHELHDLLARALGYLENGTADRRALAHFERECARLLGVLDPSGRVAPHTALAGLCGALPKSRTTAVGLVGDG